MSLLQKRSALQKISLRWRNRHVLGLPSMDDAEAVIDVWCTQLRRDRDCSVARIQAQFEFSNGAVWRGQHTFIENGLDHANRRLRESLVAQLNFCAGRFHPPSLNTEEYQKKLIELGFGAIALSRRILDECDIPPMWG